MSVPDFDDNPEIRHLSIFSGKPIAGAGEITIKQNHIVYIDSDSGHYSDSKAVMPNVINELKLDGVEVNSMEQK